MPLSKIVQDSINGGVAGSGPAFSAYMSTGQSFSQNTNTKLAIDTKLFDTANCWNTSTYRFTPNVAGYYQINLNIWIGNSGSISRTNGKIYKNGSEYLRIFDTTIGYGWTGSCVLYLNGSTDYVEAYINLTGTSPQLQGGDSYLNCISGALVRAA